jgi:hypothetical protein
MLEADHKMPRLIAIYRNDDAENSLAPSFIIKHVTIDDVGPMTVRYKYCQKE